MSEENVRKGRSVALSGVIGFVLVALLVGMVLGGVISFVVIAPMLHLGDNSQGNNGSQNTDYQNGNNYPNPTGISNNNNQNGNNNQGPISSPNNNNNQNNNNQTSDNQNSNNSQGITNNNPPITNPTGQYSSTGNQFSISFPNQSGGKDTGTITANVDCIVQQSGNSIQLDFTITPTSIPQSLSQTMQGNAVTFNFAGTTSGSQITAQATGTGGSDSTSPNFDLNLSGSFGSNTLTITVTSASDAQMSISTPQSVTLQQSS